MPCNYRDGNALQVASVEWNTNVVWMLVNASANVNALGSEYRSAVRAVVHFKAVPI